MVEDMDVTKEETLSVERERVREIGSSGFKISIWIEEYGFYLVQEGEKTRLLWS